MTKLKHSRLENSVNPFSARQTAIVRWTQALFGLLFLVTFSLQADTLTWQGSPSSYTWNLDPASLNWSNQLSVLGPYVDGSDVVFDDTAPTNAVSITTLVQPNSITVNTATTNYAFLNGGGSVGGATGLTKNGTGRFIISGANSFAGNTVINSGILLVGRTNALGVNTGTVTVNAGGTLDLRGYRLGLGIKELDVQGSGAVWTNGLQGAICSGVGSGSILGSGGGMNNIVLQGDATFRADARWDINGASRNGAGFTGNGYHLTKLGANVIWFQNIANLGLGDIDVKEGALGFQAYPIDMGDPTKTITFWPGTVFDFWTATNGLVKNMIMTNAELQAGSGSNAFYGPILLNGTNQFDVTAAKFLALQGPLSGPGGFKKTTSGFLYLNGVNTYTGPTFINSGGGRIIVGANSSLGSSSPIQLASGTALDVSAGSGLTLSAGQMFIGLGNHSIVGSLASGTASTVDVGGGSPGLLGVGALSLSGNTNLMVLGSNPGSVNGTVNSFIHVTNNLALSGVVTFKFSPVGPLDTSTPYTVLQYDGSLSSGGLANLRAISSNPNYTFTFLDPATTAPYLQVQVSGNPIPLLWKGGAPSAPNVWDQVTANWFDPSTSQNTTFINGDIVTFDDTALTNIVNLTGTISASLLCENVNNNYTFVGNGTLSGSLQQQASGLVTLALSNAPTFSSIVSDQGVLAFNIQNTNAASVAATISDDGNGLGTILQAGSNTLQLTGNNLGFSGTFVVTNGALQYASYSALGQAFAPMYVTNGGSLDFNDVDASLKNIVIAGTGFNGAGALMDSSANTSPHQVITSITLAGDATIAATGRWDLHAGGTVAGNGFNLTKIGAGQIWLPAGGDTGFENINLLAGVLGFQNQATFGDPAGTLTAGPGTILGLWAEIPQLNKNLVLTNGATFDSAGGSNSFAGTLTLYGNNTIVMRTDLGLACNIGGPGGFAAVTNDALGAAAGHSLWLYGANTYSGPTYVRAGSTVVVASGSSLGSSSLVQVDSGAKLNLSAPVVLNLGSGQTVSGNGTILGGGLSFGPGSILAVTPAGGTLTMTGDLTFQGGSTNKVTLNKTTITNTAVIGLNSVTMGGTLVIANTGSALAGGDQFQLFTAASYAGSFTNIVPSTPGAGMSWDTNALATGKLGVIVSVNTTPTNIVTQVSNNQLTLSWPADHIGWTLQVQTNSTGTGLGTNWVSVAGSSATNQMVLPIDPNNGAVFFRIIY